MTGSNRSSISEQLDQLVPLVNLNRSGKFDDLSFSHVVGGQSETPLVVIEHEPNPMHVGFRTKSQTWSEVDTYEGRDSFRSRYFSESILRPRQPTFERLRHISQVTFSAVGPSDENQERGNWSNPIEFFLSCLGFAVGLGNVWRFPYLCYTNGGGAFLIPYILMLFGCGLPMMFMELSLGQYSSQGPLTIWKIAPLFKGLGIGMVMCSFLMGIYYNMITGWALYYLFLSIRKVLPWTCCHGSWATEICVSFMSESDVCSQNAASNLSMGQFNPDNNSIVREISGVDLLKLHETSSAAKFAADQYFHNHVLGITDGLHNLGPIRPPLVVSLVLAWLIVFLVLLRGIKSFGKAVYFTSSFPYLVLILLFIRSVMEKGATEGIKFYLTPKWEKLKEAKVWGDAASQIFFSTSVCQGGIITLASYNRFKHNLYQDAVVVAIGNSITSIFSGFVVFSILGFMAHNQNTTVDQVVSGGPGLAFIAYPQAVTTLPISPLWSALFFFMLLTLALSSMFPTTENIATSIIDQFPNQLREYKFFVTLAVCVVMFFCGLPLTTKGGMYVLQMMDAYGAGYPLLVLGLFEVTLISWRYKASRLLTNIKSMIGFQPSIAWKYIWTIITPLLLIFSITLTVKEFKPLEYDGYQFPIWSCYIGFCLTSICLLPIPIYAIYKLTSFLRRQQEPMTMLSILDSLKILTSPDKAWGPALAKHCITNTRLSANDDLFQAV